MSQYPSDVALVLRNDVPLADIDILDTAELICPWMQEYYYLKWHGVMDWDLKAEPIYQWLATLDTHQYQLLVDGLDVNDFEIRGGYVDHGVSICIVEPYDDFEPMTGLQMLEAVVWNAICYGSICYTVWSALHWT
jgi:hypothetical protein